MTKTAGPLIGVAAGLVVVVGFAAWVNSLEKRIARLEQDAKVLSARPSAERIPPKPETMSALIQKPVPDGNNKPTASIALSRTAVHISPCGKILADLNSALDRNDSNEANRR